MPDQTVSGEAPFKDPDFLLLLEKINKRAKYSPATLQEVTAAMVVLFRLKKIILKPLSSTL
jgi:hypothetical protein